LRILENALLRLDDEGSAPEYSRPIADIHTDCGTHDGASANEIDELCERLNK
jgi:hypothetical protein